MKKTCLCLTEAVKGRMIEASSSEHILELHADMLRFEFLPKERGYCDVGAMFHGRPKLRDIKAI